MTLKNLFFLTKNHKSLVTNALSFALLLLLASTAAADTVFVEAEGESVFQQLLFSFLQFPFQFLDAGTFFQRIQLHTGHLLVSYIEPLLEQVSISF